MEVKQIINIILEEADIQIESAYKNGYKQGVIDYQPDVTYYQNLYADLQNKNKKSKINAILKSVGLGFVFGIITSYLIKN